MPDFYEQNFFYDIYNIIYSFNLKFMHFLCKDLTYNYLDWIACLDQSYLYISMLLFIFL